MIEDEKVELICIGDTSGLDTEEIVQSIPNQTTFILKGPLSDVKDYTVEISSYRL